MSQDNKINCFGLFTIIVSLTSSAFYGIYSSYIIHISKSTSLFSMLIGLILGLLFSKLFIYYFKSKKSKSNILFILCTLLTYIFFTYRLTSFLSNEYLIEMPNYMISLLIITLTYYISSKGLETTISVSTISFYISIILFIFDSSNLVGQINLNNFLPLFNITINDFIMSSVFFTLYFFVPIVNISFININQIEDIHNFNKYYYLAIIVSFLISFITLFNTIGVSGIQVNLLFDYPIYISLKKIKLFSFLDSIENISIMLWILYVINSSSIVLLSLKHQISNTYNLKSKTIKIIMLLLVTLSLVVPNIIFNNSNYVESLDYIYIPLSVLVIYLINIIISSIKLARN